MVSVPLVDRAATHGAPTPSATVTTSVDAPYPAVIRTRCGDAWVMSARHDWVPSRTSRTLLSPAWPQNTSWGRSR